MITASQLAGFYAAHTVWTLSDADTFSPVLAYTNANRQRQMARFVGDDMAKSVAHGRAQLASNEMDATDAVFLYDARIPIGNDKVDAIIIEMRAYLWLESEAVIAVPYTPRASGKFLVHKPTLLQWKNCDNFDMDTALQAFFAGVGEHEKGSKIWNECLDESR